MKSGTGVACLRGFAISNVEKAFVARLGKSVLRLGQLNAMIVQSLHNHSPVITCG